MWGVASSGYQSEGFAPDSNWARYDDAMEPYRNSVDFRHRYAEDIRRAARLGLKVFRFGIEWARVEPMPGQVNRRALRYYDDVVREIKAAGMTPMITLDHWVYPGWVADQGAWDNPETVEAWLANARRVVKRYAGERVIWITFNEPTIYLINELTNRPLLPHQLALMSQRLVQTHRRAYDLVHRLDPGAKVSSNVAYIPGLEKVLDVAFLDQVADKLDFLGLDYYYGASVGNLSGLNSFADDYWNIDYQPEGMLYALRFYHRQYPQLPLYVVENGMATDNGRPHPDGYTRSEHLRDHLYWLQRARAEGINVIGYNYWSITDNYEWGSYRPRFGLYTVDVVTDPTLTRRPTDAVGTYRRIIRRGGVPLAYVPVERPEWCAFDAPLETCLRLPGGNNS